MAPSIYSLNRKHEKGRLDSQHDVFKSITKTLLPDHVYAHLSTLGRAPIVADVATGSGIWLVDLARTLPAASRLDGFDVDSSKFTEELPPNVSLGYGDCLLPFPEPLHGQYDCVHVRLLATALRAEEWALVARHLLDLLRPGGWLVWDEMGHPCCTCLPMTEHFQRAIATDVRWAISLGRDVTALVRLRQHVENAGYCHCTEQQFNTYTASRETQLAASRVIIAGFGQIMHGMVDQGGFEAIQTHDVADRRTAELLGDIEKERCLIGFHIYWVSGQKPENHYRPLGWD